jgi:hypothetical protein
MKTTWLDDDRIILTVQHRLEHNKLHGIILGQQGFPFKGDPGFTARLLRRLERKDQANRAKAAIDPEYAKILALYEQLAREPNPSLDSNPHDEGFVDKNLVELRRMARADREMELRCEDLPGAHEDLCRQMQEHSDYDGGGEYDLDLSTDDHLLAMKELLEEWLHKNGAMHERSMESRSERPFRQDCDPDEDAPVDLDIVVTKKLASLFSALVKQAGVLRQRKLEKIKKKEKGLTRGR